MVETMRKLSVLMLRSGHAEFLDDLRDFGVVHVENEEFADDEGIAELQDEILRLRKTLQTLTPYRTSDFTPDGSEITDPETLCRETDREAAALAGLIAERDRIEKEIARIAPWGRFDPEILERLADAGVRFKFYLLHAHAFAETDFGGLHVEVVSEEKKTVRFVVVYRDPAEIAALTLQEEPAPRTDPATLEAERASLETAVAEKTTVLAGLAGLKGIIEERVRSIEEQLELVLTTLNLRPEAGGEILRMTGFVPSGDSDRLAAFLDSRDVVYLLEEPDKDDRIPVKLKNGRVVRLFEPITRIFGLPSYAELDTTPFFAPFFAFFFGMCLADFGYGLIVLALSAAAFFLLKKPVMKSIAALGMILGFTTLIGGVILDTLFGTRISDISDLPESISRLILFRDNDSAMYFAISLGVIQVMFGFILQTVNRIRQDGFLGGLKPIGTFLLIVGVVFYAMGALGTDFAIGPIPVGRLFHAGGIDPGRIGMVLLIGGVALVLFFNSLDKKIWLRPLLGLWEMYGIVSGVPGDILSYIRLFALGLAGGLLGGAINQIAFMVRGDTPGIISTVLMLLVLAGGHGINFALAALGAFVHPLRLTFVEFYKAVGFSGGGKAYTPFARKSITEGGNA